MVRKVDGHLPQVRQRIQMFNMDHATARPICIEDFRHRC